MTKFNNPNFRAVAIRITDLHFTTDNPGSVRTLLTLFCNPTKIISFTLPTSAISQSQVVPTVVISRDVKSPTWYGYDILPTCPGKYLIVPSWNTSRAFQARLFSPYGYFIKTTSRQNTNHGLRKLSWCDAEADHKGTITYKLVRWPERA